MSEALTINSKAVFDTDVTHRRWPDANTRIDDLSAQLVPYHDDGFLTQRMAQPNRVLRRNPGLDDVISEVLSLDDDNSLVAGADLIDEARRQSSPQNESPANMFLSLAKLELFIIDTALALGSPASRYDGLRWFYQERLMAAIPDEALPDYVFTGDYLSMRLHRIAEEAGRRGHSAGAEAYQKMGAIVSSFNADLRGRFWADSYAAMTPGSDEYTPRPAQIEADTKAIAETFKGIHTSRHYGLKLGYLPHRLGGSMIYGPVSSARALQKSVDDNQAHPQRLERYAVAEIVHSTKRSFKNIKPTSIVVDELMVGYDYTHVEPAVVMFMDSHGELFSDPHCTFSLRDMFVRHQKYAAYRELQADLIANYFDLTRPALTVERIQRTMKERPHSLNPEQNREPLDAFRRLVIPRIRTEEELRSAPTSNEVTSDEADENAKVSVTHHGVVFHRRRLPAGWQPSPQALELAAAVGMRLAEGETFVQAHQRGAKKLGEVVGHMLIHRPTSTSE